MSRNKKRRRNRRKRKTNQNFDFQKLEPRQLLAIAIGPNLPTDVNLITNGSFSEFVSNENSRRLFSDVEGWEARNADNGQLINLLEVAKDNHEEVLEIDSTASQEDSVFQSIATDQGDSYTLTFQHRGRPVEANVAEDTNDFEVFFGGENVGIFRSLNHWQTVSVQVTGADGDSSQLEFRELGANDGFGSLIDNVALVRTTPESFINNPSFETFDGASDAPINFNVLDGWFSNGPEEERLVTITTDGAAPDGEFVLNLDTNADRVDRTFQEVNGNVGDLYYVSFDLRAVDGNTDNELRVTWEDEWIATYQGGATWNGFGFLVTATSETSRLFFREAPRDRFAGSVGDVPLIDNVQILRVDSLDGVLVVDLNGPQNGTDFSVQWFEDSGPSAIVTNAIELSHSSNNTLSGATVTITNATDGTLEELDVTVGTSGLTKSYDQNVLRLTGSATVEEYESVLRTLTYNNTSQSPDETPRLIEVEIADGVLSSSPAMINLAVSSQNDDPILRSVPNDLILLGQEYTVQVNAEDGDGDTLEYTIDANGSAIGPNEVGPTIDQNGLISWTPNRQGVAIIDLFVEDGQGGRAFRTFDLRVGDQAAIDFIENDFVPFAGDNQLASIAPGLRNGIYTAPPQFTIDADANYSAIITTDDGEMRFDLLADVAPIAVNSFVNLARDGYFNNVDFHRVLSGFVAQGGDPSGTGRGGPGYQFIDEIGSVDLNDRGVLAMANSGADTNGSQFFITLQGQPALTTFTVFGQLVQGNETLSDVNINLERVGQQEVPVDGVEREIIRSIRIIGPDTEQLANVNIDGASLADSPAVFGEPTTASNDSAVGTTAPSLRGTDFDGNTVSITADGRPKAIYFLAHWCPNCQDELTEVQSLVDSGQLPANLDLYAVSTQVDSTLPNYPPSDWIEGEGWTGELIRDSGGSDAYRAYGGSNTPFVVYLDGDNNVISRSIGEMEVASILEIWNTTASS